MWLTASSCLQSKVGNIPASVFERRISNSPETHHMTPKCPRGRRLKVDGSLLPDLAAHLSRPEAKTLQFHNKRVSCSQNLALTWRSKVKGQTRPTTGTTNPHVSGSPPLGQYNPVNEPLKSELKEGQIHRYFFLEIQLFTNRGELGTFFSSLQLEQPVTRRHPIRGHTPATVRLILYCP